MKSIQRMKPVSKLLAGLLALMLMLTVCLGAVAEEPSVGKTPEEGTLIGPRTARVFLGTLDSQDTLTTWEVAGEEDVPYVPLDEYLTLLHGDAAGSPMSFEWSGNVYTISQNGQTIRADLDAQTIRCEDWRGFCGPNAAGALPAGIVERSEFIALRPSEKNISTQTAPEGYEVKLANYGLRMIRHEDDVLMPFAAAQSAFGAPFMRGTLAYNGSDYFDIVNCADSIYGNANMAAAPNPYANRWYSGPFATKEKMSEAYARYNYASLCLLLDLTFGHKAEKGIADFESYLEAQGLKEALMSTDPADDEAALEKLLGLLFDSGHDGTLLSPSVFASEGMIERQEIIYQLLQLIGYDTVAKLVEDLEPLMTLVMKLADRIGDKETAKQTIDPESEDLGPEVQELLNESMRMSILKPFLYSDNTVEIAGDTAVIYFEGFREDLTRPESYYTKLPTREDLDKSTFALLYYAFEQIKKDGNVKNVVFDVSNNGGGAAAALVSALGFLSKDGEVNITYRDLLNHSDVSEYYHVDTNLDGSFDDADGYGGQYNFYILTSGSSYSCGTAFPYFAQRDGLAKVMGQEPGGGDCVVGFYVDAAGRVGAISGFLQLGTMVDGTFVSDEDAVKPDLPMTDEEVAEVFFHADRIAEFIAKSK